ncbi:MAG: hypothetical protein R2852_04455 [Bacteroidia bacterium]
MYKKLVSDTSFTHSVLLDSFFNFYRQYIILNSNSTNEKTLFINYTLLLRNQKLPPRWFKGVGNRTSENVYTYDAYYHFSSEGIHITAYRRE